MVIGSSGISAQEGKRLLLFSVKGLISEVWKTGKVLGRLGKSRVSVEFFLSVSLIKEGPLKQGMNLAMQLESPALNSQWQWSVDRTTLSPTLNGKVGERFLLA